MIRRAVRNEEKLDITYQDEAGSLTERRIRPIAVIYYSETANIVAWCDLRQAIRNFRADRVKSCVETQDFFKQQGEALRQLWMANWQYRNAEDQSLSDQSASVRLSSRPKPRTSIRSA
jgi:predicted DNA-binding transcriptional regulator YafY